MRMGRYPTFSRSSLQTARPSILGSIRSRTTASGGSSSAAFTPFSPSSTVFTLYPAREKYSLIAVEIFSSSSTTSSDTLRSPESGTAKFSLAVFCLSVAVAIGVVVELKLTGGSEGKHHGVIGATRFGRIVQENRFTVQAQTAPAMLSLTAIPIFKDRNTMTPEERNELISKYAAGYDEVINALDGFPADSLAAHPIPGKWSAREIVHHLGDSESFSAAR